MGSNRNDYIELARELEISLDIDLSDARKQLVYDMHTGLSVFKPAAEMMSDIASLMSIDISTEYRTGLLQRDDFTRSEFVTFLIDKHNYLNRLYVFLLALQSETKISLEQHINTLLIERRYILTRIMLFRGLEECADNFVVKLAKHELDSHYSNFIFASFRKSKYAGEKKSTADLIDVYLNDAYTHIIES